MEMLCRYCKLLQLNWFSVWLVDAESRSRTWVGLESNYVRWQFVSLPTIAHILFSFFQFSRRWIDEWVRAKIERWAKYPHEWQLESKNDLLEFIDPNKWSANRFSVVFIYTFAYPHTHTHPGTPNTTINYIRIEFEKLQTTFSRPAESISYQTNHKKAPFKRKNPLAKRRETGEHKRWW